MSAIYTVLASLLVALNTLAGALLMLPFALIKFLLPIKAVRALCDHALNSIATGWVSVNGAWINAINRTRWRVSGLEGLNTKSWYLVISNHQSWVDILVLQTILNRRAPFLKFFIKHELIYVPVIGLVWWALDFPFMKRGGAATVQQDLENARKACEKFRLIPTSLISFAEGTRFTPEKHTAQKSPYKHLLKPKSGGVGMALETMGDMFTQVLDVTIAYPNGVPTFGDVLAGRLSEVVVQVQQLPVPHNLRPAPDQPISPMGLQRWIQRIWKAKDVQLEQILNGGQAQAAAPVSKPETAPETAAAEPAAETPAGTEAATTPSPAAAAQRST